MKKIYLALIAVLFQLVAFSQTDIIIGTGTTGNGTTAYPCPLQDYYEGSRMQYLYLASELTAAGMTPGNIIAIKFEVTNLNTFSGSVEQMKMSIGSTTTSTLTSNSWESGLTEVYGFVDDTVVLGTNTFTFNAPFFWNGADNIVVEVCNGDPNNASAVTYTQNPTIPWTTGLSFNGSHSYRADNIGNLCGTSNTTNTGTQTTRPNITFAWTAASSTGCYLPSGIAIANITATNADASWSPPSSGATPAQYMWELRTSGAAGSGATGLVASGATATTSVALSLLSPITNYMFYVMTDCGAGNMSTWSGATAFTTGCAAVATLNENFDGVGTGVLPVCWSKILRGATIPTAAYVQTATGNAFSTPNAVAMYNSSAGVSDEIMLVTPQLSNVGAGTYRLTFFAKNSASTEDIEVGTLDNNTSTATFTSLEVVDINTTYAKYTVSFAAYTGTDQYIALRRLNTTATSYVYIDNVVWELIPACQEATGLMHSNVTATSAQLDWTAPAGGGTPAGYHFYKSTIRTAPTDTTTATDSTTANPFTLTGLLPATKYYVWIRTNCGGGSHSPWSLADSFTTGCIAVSSLNENFDGTVTPNLPLCWSSVIRATGTTVATIKTATGNAFSTPNAVAMYNGNSPLTDDIILVTPQLTNVNAGTYQLTFYAKNSVASQDVEVGTLDDNTSTAIFTPVQLVDLGTTYQKYTVNFTGISGTDMYIGIRRSATTLSTFSYVYIDNVVWQAIPSCVEPSNVVHSNVDTASAQINWTAPGITTPVGYHIYFSTTNTPPTAATIPNDSVAAITVYNMTALLPATKYYVWVRSKCAATDYSVWSIADSFYTARAGYTPVAVSGFNADVIAEGIGPATASTTFDVDGVFYNFIAADYQYDATCALPTQSLPLSRQIYNAAPGFYFQLSPYNGDNDLRLTATDAGTLAFATPLSAEKLYLLATSGSGASKISVVINFSDGSTQAFDSLSINDWFGTTTNMVIGGIGRILRTTAACGSTSTSTTDPKLYQVPLTLDSANFFKTISSVTISRVDGITGFAGIPNILAVSAQLSGSILPVTMSDLRGERTEQGNKLVWQTKSEANNTGFEIQRSADGRSFSKVAFAETKAPAGTSSAGFSYTYIDTRPFAGTSYYRLKLIDKDGRYSLSNTVTIKGGRTNALVMSAVYPNPASSKLNVVLNTPANDKIILIITDVAGKVVMQQAAQLLSGDNDLVLNIASLPSGSYMLKAVCSNGCETAVSKVVKQ